MPIIDDYIRAVEPVHDYLTRFSGLVPGDLDPASSPHFITQLKHAYLKLRYLIDAGCIFIGHGLKQDFKMINIVVPPEQVIDTVELFHFKRQRKLSLKFLATYLLSEDIQGETHDSIEDARTAIKLYEKYLDLQARGEFEQELLEMYRYGKIHGFKGETKDEEGVKQSASVGDGLMSVDSWRNLQQDMSALGISDDGGISLHEFTRQQRQPPPPPMHDQPQPPMPAQFIPSGVTFGTGPPLRPPPMPPLANFNLMNQLHAMNAHMAPHFGDAPPPFPPPMPPPNGAPMPHGGAPMPPGAAPPMPPNMPPNMRNLRWS